MTSQGLRALGQVLAPPPTGPALRLRQAQVDSIAPDGNPRIRLGGSSVVTPPASSATGLMTYGTVLAGDIVWVWANGTDLHVIGRPGDPAWNLIGQSGQPSFLNGWQYYGSGAQPGFRKDSLGWVHLKGQLKSGSVPGTLFSLPAGYRPAEFSQFPAMSNNAYAVVDVNTTGDVVMSQGANAPPSASINGITFLAAG
jgi:hypothetical protein